MVPGALWVSHARPATSTSGAGDLLGGASVVRPAAALPVGKGGHWRVPDRKGYDLLPEYVSPVLRMWSTSKSVGYAPFISASGVVAVAGGSR